MGGAVSYLLCLFCRSGCRPSAVASSLAFFPPNPRGYTVREHADGTLELILPGSYLDYASEITTSVHHVHTRRGSVVVGICLKHPAATHTVLFSHGNASDCGTMMDLYIMLAKHLRVNVFAYDYSGYGCSTGTPLESNCYADIDAAYDYVCKTGMCSNPADELILYGQSVGSGATCYLASTRPVRAVILHSPILSGLRVLTRSRLLACFDIFPNHSRIARVHCPVFVMHGHNDIVARQPEEYLRQLERFLLWLSASSSGTPLDVIAEDTPWAPASHGSDGFV